LNETFYSMDRCLDNYKSENAMNGKGSVKFVLQFAYTTESKKRISKTHGYVFLQDHFLFNFFLYLKLFIPLKLGCLDAYFLP
jgi:hypothetical protein